MKQSSPTLKDIDNFFKNREKPVTKLELQCALDDIYYNHKDNISNEDVKLKKNEMLNYCYKKYNNLVATLKFNEVKFGDFQKAMEVERKRRYICGVIAYVGPNEVVAIVNSINQLNFPKGKEDFLDNKIKKLTAFREFGEETGYWVSVEEYKNCTKYVEIYHFEKVIRLYFLHGCTKSWFNLNHTCKGEVKGLKFVKLNSIIEMKKTSLFYHMVNILNPDSKATSKNTPGKDNTESWREYRNKRKINKEKFAPSNI